MLNRQTIHRLWLVLLALTVAGIFIGEAAPPGLAVTLLIVLTMAFKGRMVIDHFMGMKTANPTLRKLMHAYFYVVPLATALTYVHGDLVARYTTL